MKDRVRFGKYIRVALTVGDFIVVNLAYFLICFIVPDTNPLDSKWAWLIANLAFIPSSAFFSGIHNDRIIYADRVVINALQSSVLYSGTFLALLYIFDLYHVGATASLSLGVVLFILLSLWWIISRKLLKRFRRMGFNFKRVIIIGTGPTGRLVARELASDAGYGYRLMGLFDDDINARAQIQGEFTASLDEVENFVRLNNIDIIYYTVSGENEETIRRMMLVADEAGAEFVYVPKYHPILQGQFQLSSVGMMPAMTHILSPLHTFPNKMVKRTLDLAMAIPFCLLSPIIFVPIAIAIKISSPGPVFFRQKRTGIYGRDFVCYKFRTMRVNDQADTLQATANDPRKTKLGDFLRRTSIDELPQFFNVLIGNMSVVGPRPHMISHTEEYSTLIDRYMVRHAVKPGITGWAQVNGFRGATKQLWQMEKRVEHDVWYIRNWNIFLDLKIIFLTLFNSFRGEKNAY